jgi:hypothetical protein
MPSIDQIVEAVAALLLLAHAGAFVWAGLLRKGIASVVALNLIVSASIVIYWAPHILELLKYADVELAFVGFEFFVLGTSLFAVRSARVPHTIIWLEFAVHALFVLAALTFMFTFKINRLI